MPAHGCLAPTGVYLMSFALRTMYLAHSLALNLVTSRLAGSAQFLVKESTRGLPA